MFRAIFIMVQNSSVAKIRIIPAATPAHADNMIGTLMTEVYMGSVLSRKYMWKRYITMLSRPMYCSTMFGDRHLAMV